MEHGQHGTTAVCRFKCGTELNDGLGIQALLQLRHRQMHVFRRVSRHVAFEFWGRSATSTLRRRKTHGSIDFLKLSTSFSWPSARVSMSRLKLLVNSFSEPRRPGWKKSKRHHRSAREFSTGVPVQAILKSAQRFGRSSHKRARVLDLLGLVAHQDPPGGSRDRKLIVP